MKKYFFNSSTLSDIDQNVWAYYNCVVIKKILKAAKHVFSTTFQLPWLYGRISYAQEGEDLVLQKLFADKKIGVYIDVGAHHPYRYSNTFWLYQHGWQGINIDATPGSMASFDTTRPRDINVEVAISDRSHPLFYYLFEDGALNSLSKEVAESVILHKQSKLIRKEKITPLPLKVVLDRWLPKNKKIDLLSVDVEGADLHVLQSNDWKKYSPEIVLIEILFSEDIEKVLQNPAAIFLKKQGYTLIARTFNSAFFRKK